jgi:hypothetical protein
MEELETITSTRIEDNPVRDSNPVSRRYEKRGMPGKKYKNKGKDILVAGRGDP